MGARYSCGGMQNGFFWSRIRNLLGIGKSVDWIQSARSSASICDSVLSTSGSFEAAGKSKGAAGRSSIEPLGNVNKVCSSASGSADV